jgi:putative spermidine/putrescine transport system ATP-binding protein
MLGQGEIGSGETGEGEMRGGEGRRRRDGAAVAGAVREVAGTVREVAYLGSVTRYQVRLDRGETLMVVRQNLDTSAAEALQERGRRVRLVWRARDESALDTTQEEEV